MIIDSFDTAENNKPQFFHASSLDRTLKIPQLVFIYNARQIFITWKRKLSIKKSHHQYNKIFHGENLSISLRYSRDAISRRNLRKDKIVNVALSGRFAEFC